MIKGKSEFIEIINATFDSCSCNYNDGEAIHNELDYILIRGYNNKTSFIKCFTERKSKKNQNNFEPILNGGSMYCIIKCLNSSFNLSHVEFRNGESANKSEEGNDVYLSVHNISGSIDSSLLLFLKNDDDDSNENIIYLSGVDESFLMNYLLDVNKFNLSACIYYVKGKNEHGSGKAHYDPCSDISNTISHIYFGIRTIYIVKEI